MACRPRLLHRGRGAMNGSALGYASPLIRVRAARRFGFFIIAPANDFWKRDFRPPAQQEQYVMIAIQDKTPTKAKPLRKFQTVAREEKYPLILSACATDSCKKAARSDRSRTPQSS